ncbi:carbon starvation CstA family protein [Vibrio metschnikovii]
MMEMIMYLTNKYVLWGHHFTSVAGAAPIIDPAIAVIWGWVPAFIWIVLARFSLCKYTMLERFEPVTVTKPKSVGALTGDIIGPRARSLFMIVIFLVLLMVNAVFAVVIARQLISFQCYYPV